MEWTEEVIHKIHKINKVGYKGKIYEVGEMLFLEVRKMGKEMKEVIRVYKLVREEIKPVDKNSDIILTLLEELEKLIPNGKTTVNLVKTTPQKQKQFYMISGERKDNGTTVKIQGMATEELIGERTVEVEVGDGYRIVIRRRW